MTRAGLSHRNINIEEASNSSTLLMSQEDANTGFLPFLRTRMAHQSKYKIIHITGTRFVQVTVRRLQLYMVV